MKSAFAKLVTILLLVVVLATACSPAPTPAPQPTTAPVVEQPTAVPATEAPTAVPATVAPTAEPVTLHALIRPDEGGNIAQYSAEFTKQTGINVQVDFVGWDTIHDKTISTLSSGGGGYDIVFIPSGNAYEFASGGWFDNVDDIIPAAERDQWLKPVLDLYSTDGHLFASPWYSGGAHMAYNTDVLTKAGIDASTLKTWDDFMAACKTIKEKKAADFCFTPSAKYAGEFYYSIGTMVLANGGDFFDAAGKPVFQSNGAGLKAFSILKDGIDKGYFNPAGVDMDDYATLIEFGTGKTAFMLNSTWSATNANNNKDVSKILGKVGYMLIPGNGTVASAGYLYAGGLGILKTSTHKAEAMKYIQFQTSAAAQKDHAIKGANMPTRVALFKDADIAAAWPGFATLAEQLTYGKFPPQFTWFEEWRHSLSSAEQQVLQGAKTAQQAVDWLVTETTRISGQ